MRHTQAHSHPTAWAGRAWRKAWPFLLLALLCVVFYWDALWLAPSRLLGGNDLSAMFLRWLTYARSSLGAGHLPLWNPYLFSGQPFIANPQPALFYPLTWLSFVMPVTRAMALIIVLHVWLGGAGMAAWLRSEGATPLGALFGAVAFSFSGYAFVRVQAGHMGVITTGAWLPVILWLYNKALSSRSWAIAAVAGLPVGLAFLAGHTATFVYVAIGLAAYALFIGAQRWREQRHLRGAAAPLGTLAIAVAAGLALAAVQILPLAEMAAQSTRQAGLGYEFSARFSWSPGYLLTLLVPNFFGEPVRTGYWGDGVYDEVVFYIGVLPLVCALLAFRLRHRLRPFLLTLGLGALLLALGEYGALHRIFYRFVPFFSLTRAPGRAGFLFVLAASALAGLLVTALQVASPEDRRRLLRPMNTPVALGVAATTAMLTVAGFAAFALTRQTNPEAGRLWHLGNRLALFLFLFLLSAGLLAAWRRARDGQSAFAVLALLLALVDLWAFGGEIARVVKTEESAYWQTVRRAVPDPDAWRVLPWGLSDFEQNDGMPYGLRSVFGYDPLILHRYEAFITSRPDPRARTYDLLNARYLVTPGAQDFAGEPDAPRLLLEQGGVWVYERPTALPRAWITHQVEVVKEDEMLNRIHDPAFDPLATTLVSEAVDCGEAGEVGTATVTRDEGNAIEVSVVSDGGLLVLSEVDYPGWRAKIDGVATPLVRANYLLRGLCLPPGQHTIELTYWPPLLTIGLAMSGVALIAIVGCVAVTARAQKAQP